MVAKEKSAWTYFTLDNKGQLLDEAGRVAINAHFATPDDAEGYLLAFGIPGEVKRWLRGSDSKEFVPTDVDASEPETPASIEELVERAESRKRYWSRIK